jgi:hypothetical protein
MMRRYGLASEAWRQTWTEPSGFGLTLSDPPIPPGAPPEHPDPDQKPPIEEPPRPIPIPPEESPPPLVAMVDHPA